MKAYETYSNLQSRKNTTLKYGVNLDINWVKTCNLYIFDFNKRKAR